MCFFSTDSTSISSWIINSGASHHMTQNSHFLSTYTPLVGNKKVNIVDGSFSAIAGKGTVKLTSFLTLFDVLHVPKLSHNLLSFGELTQNLNCHAILDNTSCVFQDKVLGRMIGNARDSEGLCFLQDGYNSVNFSLVCLNFVLVDNKVML
ncbi:hypothetical protein T459_25004 [Capsicum annuum]|uniref:Retrovirus-related Pol polyprotein from transposon TNT 1-94-like beta-barrel domain-containing protein n=1 Tax=Capsicum annuum TaxID=4072 RepID=A0A2G2YJI8_CAPAN|nr:hypothetical protein T459_25004 [Capsicum annuum]